MGQENRRQQVSRERIQSLGGGLLGSPSGTIAQHRTITPTRPPCIEVNGYEHWGQHEEH
jgi:hypothetical protein